MPPRSRENEPDSRDEIEMHVFAGAKVCPTNAPPPRVHGGAGRISAVREVVLIPKGAAAAWMMRKCGDSMREENMRERYLASLS